MADYNSMKVPELKKLLTERGLPHTGNKADLIARLTENDNQKAGDAAKPQADSKKPATEDEIDYEDDDVPTAKSADVAETKPAPETAPAPATEEKTAEAAPAETTTTNIGEESKTAEDKPTTAELEPAKPVFTQNLPPTNAKTEAEKRAARAARFGIATDENSEEAKKAARAARFGVANDQVSALDSALPDRPLRKRGRGEGGGEGKDEENGGRGGKRPNRGAGKQQQQQQQQRGGRGQQQGGRRQGTSGRAANGGNAQKGGNKPRTIADDPAEKAKMEARAKRFAAAASS
ncbi:hypothetical protein VTI74DRAFT_2043 [Chaetomium olivicolor]